LIDAARDNVSVLLCVVGAVCGVTQLDDVVYIVCLSSSTIIRFHATTHQRLTDINVKGLSLPWDIAACQQTSQLYVTDNFECIWRVSSDGEDIERWWPKSSSDTFSPRTLSVTSSLVLVTSQDTNELMQLDAAGQEPRRVGLPDYMKDPQHAVESVTGTFIVSHVNTQLNDQHQVSEVNTAGRVLRHFSSGSLGDTPHIAVDSQRNIFVADYDNRCILLLDARLELRRVIIDEHQLNDKQRPYRLCYNEQSAQLMVGFDDYDSERGVSGGVAVFDVLE